MEDLIKLDVGILKQYVKKLVVESITSTRVNQRLDRQDDLLTGLLMIFASIIIGVRFKCFNYFVVQ